MASVMTAFLDDGQNSHSSNHSKRTTRHDRPPRTGDAMKQQCDNCPFATKGPGLHLRKSLGPGLWREIALNVMMGQPFFCHKTTDDDSQDEDSDYYRPTGKEQVCFGSLEYLRKARR